MQCGIEMNAKLMKQHRHVIAQQGVALVVALVFLLVMTVVGVSSFVNTTLQERMVSSARQSDLAEQAAIAAVNVAEQTLTSTMGKYVERYTLFDTTNNCAGLYQPFPIRNKDTLTVSAAKAIAFDVNDDTAWDATNSLEAKNALKVGAVVSKNPRYLIELIGFGDTSGVPAVLIQDGGESAATTAEYAVYFRITARGWAQDENVSSLVQATVKMILEEGAPAVAVCPS